MKVTGPSGPAGATGARSAPAQTAAPGFSIGAPAVSTPAGVSAAGGVNAVNTLEALMALQEVGGPLERRRRAVRRADTILDALEGLKIELLEGALGPAMLDRLTRAVREQRSMTDDPKLEGLLDQVETRAAVELAKLEGARVAT
ncbi:MAG TPA: flagellar assembly protein FliX [Caulobacteraceae bacterium]|nr:flagellar assembly protein FliX [Caulobacteraceae bacterium]